MSVKYALYILVSIITVWAFDAININNIFKKNRKYQAITFYFLLMFATIYLVTNFILDVASAFKL